VSKWQGARHPAAGGKAVETVPPSEFPQRPEIAEAGKLEQNRDSSAAIGATLCGWGWSEGFAEMPITVTCVCGRKLAAKDEYAGRTVKCPGCAQPLKIPTPTAKVSPSSPTKVPKTGPKKPVPVASSAAQLLEEAGLAHHIEGPTCPECGQGVAEEALLCVHCGYNFKLKRRLKTVVAHDDETPGGSKKKRSPVKVRSSNKPMTETDKTLAKAALDLEKEPIEQEKGYGTKSGAWFLTLIMLAGMAAFIAGGIALVNYIEGRAAQSSQDDERW
jgi:hypothetical protein